MSPQSNIWPNTKWHFSAKVMENFRKAPSLSDFQLVTIMQSVSAGLKAATLFVDMSPLIQANTRAHTHMCTHPYIHICQQMSVSAHWLNKHKHRHKCIHWHTCVLIFCYVCKYMHKHVHTQTQMHTFATEAHIHTQPPTNIHFLLSVGQFLLVVKWPCCHLSLHLFPWGWTGERKSERKMGKRER